MRVAKGRKGRTGKDEIVPSDPQLGAVKLGEVDGANLQ
jgi:hypothetical protein